MSATTKRPRISIDVHPAMRRRLRLAAAKRDLTIRRYVLESEELPDALALSEELVGARQHLETQ